MKTTSTVTLPLIVLSVLLWTASPALADAGVYYGIGQDLHQITSKSIHLVSIDVTIVLGGPSNKLAETMAQYRCKFVLGSLSDNPEEVRVGFPVDFDTGNAGLDEKDYAFVARDEKITYPVELSLVHPGPDSGPGDSGNIFSWKMHFEPKEKKTLVVTYQMPISGGLGDTSKEDMMHRTQAEKDLFRELENSGGVLYSGELDDAAVFETGYITSTGSSWSGNVESATFALITDPFEQYINLNLFPKSEMRPSPELGGLAPIPLQHPWSFWQIKPEGWKAVKGGVQWSYKNYKPKDTIEVAYFVTNLPKSPSEVNTFVDWILKRLKPTDSVPAELTKVKEVLLATYGKEPEDGLTRRFVEEQLWYAPRKGFSMAQLSETQKAVIEKLDARIALAKRTK